MNLTHKKLEAEKNGDKDENALYKLMNNALYDKTIENLRNRIYVKLISKKRLFKIDIKIRIWWQFVKTNLH